MSTNLKRLEQVEERVKALGWLWGNFHEAITDLAIASKIPKFLTSGDISPAYNEKIFEVAERLLALYEKGSTIKIDTFCYDCVNPECSPDCDFLLHSGNCIMGWNDDFGKPNDDCLGKGIFKFVKIK